MCDLHATFIVVDVDGCSDVSLVDGDGAYVDGGVVPDNAQCCNYETLMMLMLGPNAKLHEGLAEHMA